MLRNHLAGFAAIAAAALSTPAVPAQDMAPPCLSRLLINADVVNDTRATKSDASGGVHCVRGGPTALQLEVHRTTIAAVLSALFDAFQVSYRSSVPLNETRDGTYEGSLGYVISRVLDGYNYVIKRENSNLEIIIFNKRGKQAVPGPIITEASQNRASAPVSRIR
jgi:hypothetical protein